MEWPGQRTCETRPRRVTAGATSRRDRSILYVTAFLRALATGLIGVLLGLYLARLDLDSAAIGLVVSAGLFGAATATFLTTAGADRLGRRRFLVALGLIGAAGGVAVALGTSVTVLAVAAFLGMVNGMGRDRGAALVLDQAILPGTSPDQDRTRVFAWYNLLQDAGHALGALMAALPTLLNRQAGVDELTSLRAAVLCYAVLIGVTGVLYVFLSPAVETRVVKTLRQVTPRTRSVLVKLSSLFALDSLGGGFLTTALLSYFFHERFGVGAATLGFLFFGARVANALSHLGAAWLAVRIGLVNTMVFTHLPSSLLLLTVPFAPTFGVAAILFLIREGLVEMDVPTRQSYVMAMVQPEERTLASGVTHLVRMGMWAVAPAFAGLFMKEGAMGLPLMTGAGLKIAYDILLYRSFRKLKPPEEAAQVVG
jgi:MFS family permease